MISFNPFYNINSKLTKKINSRKAQIPKTRECVCSQDTWLPILEDGGQKCSSKKSQVFENRPKIIFLPPFVSMVDVYFTMFHPQYLQERQQNHLELFALCLCKWLSSASLASCQERCRMRSTLVPTLTEMCLSVIIQKH